MVNIIHRKLCSHMPIGNYYSSHGILNNKIAIIVIVLNEKNYEDYMVAINTTLCYSKLWGYQMYLINMEKNAEIEKYCNQTDVFFRRHCALTLFMEANKGSIDYVLYIDADMGVINPCHNIQEYIDKNKTINMIFYERYFNHEFAAGSYLIRNTKKSREFLMFWANYFFKLPQSFHGTDNGALHQVFMELHFTDKKSQMLCYNLWNVSKNYDDLFTFQACTKHFLFSNASSFLNNTVKIIRKMSPGWVRDGWLTNTKWSKQDFMFHGWKKSKLGGEWNWPFKNSFDMKSCNHGNISFPNFNHAKNFTSTDDEIKSILKNRTDIVNEKYNEFLKKLNFL